MLNSSDSEKSIKSLLRQFDVTTNHDTPTTSDLHVSQFSVTNNPSPSNVKLMQKISGSFQNLLTTVAYIYLHATSAEVKFVGCTIECMRNTAAWELVFPYIDKGNKQNIELYTDASHRTDFSIGWLSLINKKCATCSNSKLFRHLLSWLLQHHLNALLAWKSYR